MAPVDDNYRQDYHVYYGERVDRLNPNSGVSALSDETYGYSRTNSQASTSTLTNEDSFSPDGSPFLGHPLQNFGSRDRASLTRKLSMRLRMMVSDEKNDDQGADYLELQKLEMMKEKFAKLLLGEDMSGSGKGVCTAVAISNAITNLYATVFGQLYRLEPLNFVKRLMWKREMECLLSVCDYIVDFVPSWQVLPNGKKQEVMTSHLRSDIQMNLPALQKLDNMLLGILDNFGNTEFWYADHRQGTLPSDGDDSGQMTPRQEEKWWLYTPRVPPRGLSDKSRKHLQQKRESASQILKAAVATNSSILAEMAVPESYMETLPKTGKATLGEKIYKYITNPEHFFPEDTLDCLDLSTEHNALDIANKVEASIYVWARKGALAHSKSSWDLVTADGGKMDTLTDRAKSLLLCLKQRCPGLSQTSLDTSKIQYNKDVGQAVLESYSRVLESLAYTLVSLIDDVLRADDIAKESTSTKLFKTIPSDSPRIFEVRVDDSPQDSLA